MRDAIAQGAGEHSKLQDNHTTTYTLIPTDSGFNIGIESGNGGRQIRQTMLGFATKEEAEAWILQDRRLSQDADLYEFGRVTYGTGPSKAMSPGAASGHQWSESDSDWVAEIAAGVEALNTHADGLLAVAQRSASTANKRGAEIDTLLAKIREIRTDMVDL